MIFHLFDSGPPAAQFSWDYDQFFFDRWYREARTALVEHPERSDDLHAAGFCVAAVTLGCVSFASIDREFLAHEVRRYLALAQGRPLVVFDFSDQPQPLLSLPGVITCKSAFHEFSYLPDQSVALPQFPRYRFEQSFTAASTRRYLAAFKGNPRPRYTDVRSRLMALDGRNRFVVKGGVFMPRDVRVTSDGEAHECVRNGEPSYTQMLFDSTFALLPRACGWALSYRMIESMNAGCIPVIISDGYVLPFCDRLDYERFSIRIAESDVEHLPQILEARLPDADRLQEEAYRTYKSCFSSTAAILAEALRGVASRAAHVGRHIDAVPVAFGT